MSIAVSVRPVSHPLKAPFRISRGVKTAAEVVEAVASADGHVGRGESVPYGRYGETVDSVLAQLAAALASSDVEAACAALNPVPSFEFDLDVFKNIILEKIGTKDQRATLLRILSQHKPAKGNLALKLAHALEEAGVPILGTSPDAIDLAEDRERFQQLLRRLDLRQPRNGIARSASAARKPAPRFRAFVSMRDCRLPAIAGCALSK